MLRVEHDHAVAHTLDQRIARHRHDVEQPKLEDAPGERQAGEREARWRQVEAGPRVEAEEVERIANPGRGDADEHGACLPAIQARGFE